VCTRTLTSIRFVLKFSPRFYFILCIRIHEHAKEPSELGFTPILLLCSKQYFWFKGSFECRKTKQQNKQVRWASDTYNYVRAFTILAFTILASSWRIFIFLSWFHFGNNNLWISRNSGAFKGLAMKTWNEQNDHINYIETKFLELWIGSRDGHLAGYF
jgi:hypothetical protein